MIGTLTTDLFDETSLYFKKAGEKVEIIKDGLTRNEFNGKTYEKYDVPQVVVKYPFASIAFLDGRVENVYHECKIDAFRIKY